MADYMSREAAIEWFAAFAHMGEDNIPTDTVISDLKHAIPAADVEPVRHGVWENTSEMYGVYSGRCSVCKLGSGMWHINQPYRFCPFCGARLNLEGKKK